MFSFVLLLGACTAPADPTIVRETVVSELPVTVEVTRIVPQIEEVTRIVEEPVMVEVTRIVEAEVEVTRVIEVVRLVRPVTADELIGYWQGGVFIAFAEDGTFVAANSRSDALGSRPPDIGTYRFDGTILGLTSSDLSFTCRGTGEATYQAFFNEDGRLELDHINDRCDDRGETALTAPFRRVE